MNTSVNLLAASRIIKICTLEQLWADVTMRGNPSLSELMRKPCKHFEGLPVWADKGVGSGKGFRAWRWALFTSESPALLELYRIPHLLVFQINELAVSLEWMKFTELVCKEKGSELGGRPYLRQSCLPCWNCIGYRTFWCFRLTSWLCLWSG